MGKKERKNSVTVDLENCDKMQHLKPIPKSRSSSITSIESNGSFESVLRPPPMKEFDDLRAFEAYIRDETWENDFDYLHAHLKYYPPFILKECHENLDKVKPTANKNSRKFKRNLQHHVQRHLMKEMAICGGYNMDFKRVDVRETPKTMVWTYEDSTDHGFNPEEEDAFNRHWKLQLEVCCNNENAMVDVDYRAIPL
ncbi:Respiratory growth induced protein 1 [Yamadazyma tenuis]|uniref:Respiratory growth induced protein 1 n=1 Tax=Candida tenuis (strain ATCC 10573 / BCRC 21748 / CBS 615 / JCM 9827 / NBRC 10315 / NRRL Y-1498 / VKM Y-70) TaxID=590646 RepID=G3B1C0_CANTC|nr:uncharacterized protein CANTEDRAFT_121140 [Yamadazyma tenuis ATCC 10573]EGV64934.1 hypothetical protein CANTEDRAFT_121140 [Yamadazyma tenuis ATCC 10573]WEJ97732.1 Respiratory growth induced protein 1 [Yamadazyma tenuis]